MPNLRSVTKDLMPEGLLMSQNQVSTASIIIVSNLVVHTQVWQPQTQGSLMTMLLYKQMNRNHPGFSKYNINLSGHNIETRAPWVHTSSVDMKNYLLAITDGSNQFRQPASLQCHTIPRPRKHTQVWWTQPRRLLITQFSTRPPNRSQSRRCTEFCSAPVTWSRLSEVSMNATYPCLDAILE